MLRSAGAAAAKVPFLVSGPYTTARLGCGERPVEVRVQPRVRGGSGAWQGSDHEGRPWCKPGQLISNQVPEPPAHRVAHDRAADGLGDDETGARRWRRAIGARRHVLVGGFGQVDHDRATAGPPPAANHCGEVAATPQSLPAGQHDCRSPQLASGTSSPSSARFASTRAAGPRSGADSSGREPGTALGPARRNDRTPGTGTHAQPEAVGLGAAAVVRLVCALAHVRHSSWHPRRVATPRQVEPTPRTPAHVGAMIADPPGLGLRRPAGEQAL